MNTRAGRTHAVTYDITLRTDCISVLEMQLIDRSDEHQLKSSWRCSGGMETVISSVSSKTPRKTITVAGGGALSREVFRPKPARREPNVWKAAADLSGVSAPPKSSM